VEMLNFSLFAVYPTKANNQLKTEFFCHKNMTKCKTNKAEQQMGISGRRRNFFLFPENAKLFKLQFQLSRFSKC
jgi:hypothetical protein